MYDLPNIQDKIMEIINSNIENAEISLEQVDDDLLQLGMTSIIFITSIIAMEDAFGIEVPDEYLLFYKMNTISKMTKVIEKVLQNN